MKNLSCALMLVIVFAGCSPSAVKQSFSGADSLVIYFKNEQAEEITRTVQTAEAKAIRRVIEFIDGRETMLFNCGYDGKMLFFSKGEQVQEVDFKMKNDTCNHFAFLLNGKLLSTKMNSEAVDFLDALERGMPYY